MKKQNRIRKYVKANLENGLLYSQFDRLIVQTSMASKLAFLIFNYVAFVLAPLIHYADTDRNMRMATNRKKSPSGKPKLDWRNLRKSTVKTGRKTEVYFFRSDVNAAPLSGILRDA